MSIAGKRSDSGDEYQLRVAIHWLLHLLSDDAIDGIQVNSVGWPGMGMPVTVDDIVVRYNTGNFLFIQAKKNQPGHATWSLKDRSLVEELKKARDQLENCPGGRVEFYSTSPFGELEKIATDCAHYPDYPSFLRDMTTVQEKILGKLSNILERPKEDLFNLVKQIGFGSHHSFDEWDRHNQRHLTSIVTRPKATLRILERMVESHQADLRSVSNVMRKKDILDELKVEGIYLQPKIAIATIISEFKRASMIGRMWDRKIDGVKILRPEYDDVISAIHDGHRTILVTSGPGGGKTCLLLEVADYIDVSDDMELLFIKGDRFESANIPQDLSSLGLSFDIVECCAALAEAKRVVVVIDSMDVLSLSRSHSSLKLFLTVIDQLFSIKGVTLIAACREFDLKFDPNLRVRNWDSKISLSPLDYSKVVAPFLNKWGVDAASISNELKALLVSPQNLSLYERVCNSSASKDLVSEYDLYDLYLDQVVLHSTALGQSALDLIFYISDELVNQRSTSIPVEKDMDREAIRHLVSKGVLRYVSGDKRVSFGHQSMGDFAVVRSAASNKETLLEYIQSHEPLPFIRPSVRSFFFFLRGSDRKTFRQQIWSVINDNGVAYHLKRMVIESLAEIHPDKDDHRLMMRIFRHHPRLFKRFLIRVVDQSWFDYLTGEWLNSALSRENSDDYIWLFINKIEIWSDGNPTEVINLWLRAIDEKWLSPLDGVARTISFNLINFKQWRTKGLLELLHKLIDLADEAVVLPKAIGRFVEANDNHYELLFKSIVMNVNEDCKRLYDLEKSINCSKHLFHDKGFIKERLVRSESFMDLMVKQLISWSSAFRDASSYPVNLDLLNYTTWESCHYSRDMRSYEDIHYLMDGIENAFIVRAMNNDPWWRSNEPKLRKTDDAGLRYLLIQGYFANPEENIDGIKAQVVDGEMMRYGKLKYELGQLANATIHLMADHDVEACQEVVHNLYSDLKVEGDEIPIWSIYDIYDILMFIPPMFRTEQTIQFVDRWECEFGYRIPYPRIYGRGGWVRSPIGQEQMINLTNDGLKRYLAYYNDLTQSEYRYDSIVGGRNEVSSTLRTVSSLDPLRFLSLYDELIAGDYFTGFAKSILSGVSNHIQHRFGNLRANGNCKPVEPLPDGIYLAKMMLDRASQGKMSEMDNRTMADVLRACSDVLTRDDEIEQITALVGDLLASDSAYNTESTRDDIRFDALNSFSGIAAEAAVTMTCNLLENDIDLPPSLIELLHQISTHPSPVVRSVLLGQRLAFIEYRKNGLGWSLFEEALEGALPQLWKESMTFLYYQYNNHPNMVMQLLNRSKSEIGRDVGVRWGNLIGLIHIAGHIDLEALVEWINSGPELAWRGAAQVFSHNLSNQIAHNGLHFVIDQNHYDDKALGDICSDIFSEENDPYVSISLIEKFMPIYCSEIEEIDFYYALIALNRRVRQDPEAILRILEIIVAQLESHKAGRDYLAKNDVANILIEILRDADESDDSNYIHRAITIQDRFLRMDFLNLEEAYSMNDQA